MAKICTDFQAVAEIVREALKLPIKDKKNFLFSIFSSINFLSVAAIIGLFLPLTDDSYRDGVTELVTMDRTSSEYQTQVAKIKHVSMLLVLVELLYVVLLTLAFLLSLVLTIYFSSISYLKRCLTIKELYLEVKKIWIRPFITWLYITLLSIGFPFLIICLIVLVSLAGGSIYVASLGIVLLLVAGFFSLYFSVVGMLGLVNSVSEDFYGFEAIGNDVKLLQGREVVGHLLSFIWTLLFLAVCGISMVLNIRNDPTPLLLIVYVELMFVTMVVSVVKILNKIAYAIFDFKCKESHGEQVDIEEGIKSPLLL